MTRYVDGLCFEIREKCTEEREHRHILHERETCVCVFCKMRSLSYRSQCSTRGLHYRINLFLLHQLLNHCITAWHEYTPCRIVSMVHRYTGSTVHTGRYEGFGHWCIHLCSSRPRQPGQMHQWTKRTSETIEFDWNQRVTRKIQSTPISIDQYQFSSWEWMSKHKSMSSVWFSPVDRWCRARCHSSCPTLHSDKQTHGSAPEGIEGLLEDMADKRSITRSIDKAHNKKRTRQRHTNLSSCADGVIGCVLVHESLWQRIKLVKS